MDLQRLIYLCHLKNELNRRRRRFHYYIDNGCSDHISKREAINGYRKAKQNMKAMTHEMRQMRLAMGVRFIWNWSGHIEAIEVLSTKQRIRMKDFKKFYDSELFEMTLFTKD